MAFRAIFIENPARISVRNNQLMIRTDTERSVSLEDITAVMLESRQCTITTAALSLLGQQGCCVYLCDDKHLPCAVLTPYHQHSREPVVLQNQLEAGAPLKKRLWQSVVREKIRNHAKCLQLTDNRDAADRLLSMIPRVQSGDPGNLESAAAQIYFPALFYPGFTRGSDSGYNAGLNYGYAILRAYVARTLAAYGFLPALGIHHHSTLNAFNLADDLMEPFRPLIDLLVVRTMEEDSELSPSDKHSLFNCLNLDVLSGGQHHSTAYAIERMVQSLGQSLSSKKASLVLPQLVELNQHRYE